MLPNLSNKVFVLLSLCFFCFHNLHEVKAEVKALLKVDNQGITGYFKSPLLLNESRNTPFYSKI